MRKSPRQTDTPVGPDAPDLPAQFAALGNAAELFREGSVQIQERLIENLAAADLPPISLRLESCVVRRANFANAKLPNLRLRDVRLEGCDLANVDARGLVAVRVEFLNCRMTGFRAAEADCKDVRISGGDQRYLQLRFGRFKSALFEACNFEEADFGGTDLRGARFQQCSLIRAEMTGVKLAGADLRGSRVEGLRLNAADISGATVDPAQAMIFAPLLGIKVR